MEEYCVMCGRIIPEGTHVCVHCGELHEPSVQRKGRKLLPGSLFCKGNRYSVLLKEDKLYIDTPKGHHKLSCKLRDLERLYYSNHKLFGRYCMILRPAGSHSRYCISYREKDKAPFQSLNEVLEDNCKILRVPFWSAFTGKFSLHPYIK